MGDSAAGPGLFPGAPLPPPSSPVVDWITQGTAPGRTVRAAIPADFDRYATIVVPDGDDAKSRADAALVEVLQANTPDQPWWLGFLDTGVAALPAAPLVSMYYGWTYALIESGPQEVLTTRRPGDDITPWHSALPELIVPADRSWLVSTMWDDAWRCVGGPAALVQGLLERPELEARAVTLDEDVTPPGHSDD